MQFSAVASRLEFQSEITSTHIYSTYAHIKMYFKVIRIKLQKNLRGILFAPPVCYTNSRVALADIYTYISLRFTQSNSPTHAKSLFSFRNTRISRISTQSVSASSCKLSTHRENTLMQAQLQVLWPVRKSVDGLPAICFRR